MIVICLQCQAQHFSCLECILLSSSVALKNRVPNRFILDRFGNVFQFNDS